MGRTSSAGATAPAASAAATAARVAGQVSWGGAVATVPGSIGITAAVPLAEVNFAASMVRKRCPSGDAHDGMFMAFSFRAS